MKAAAMLRPFLAAMAAFFFLAGPALADTAIDPAYDRFKLAITGNTARVTFGSDGTPLAMPAGSSPTAVGSSGAAFYNRTGTVPTKYGPLPVTVSQRFPIGKLASGVGAVLGGPLGVALFAAPFVYDWLTDAGISTQNGQIGVITGGDNDGLDWSYDTIKPAAWQPTHAAACAYMASYTGLNIVVGSGLPNPKCNRVFPDGAQWAYTVYTRTAANTPGTFQPVTSDGVVSALNSTPRTASEIEKILSETIQYPEIQPDPVDTPVVTPTAPSPAKVSSKQTVSSDGTVKTEETSCYVVGGVGGVTHEISLVENCTTTTTEQKPVTLPDGTTATHTTTTTGTATVSDPQQSGEEFAMPCGIPGTPPCAVKVDETGVPTADDLDVNKGKEAEKELDDFIRDPTSIIPAFPTINWAFALPSSCGVIPTPQFSPFFDSIDVCQFQPVFHDVMNVVWLLGGLFGAISLFMKSALAD